MPVLGLAGSALTMPGVIQRFQAQCTVLRSTHKAVAACAFNLLGHQSPSATLQLHCNLLGITSASMLGNL